MKDEWISVDDKLPPPFAEVFVAGGVGYLHRDGNWYTLTGCTYPGKVIQWRVKYWMPLPEPLIP